MRSSAISCQIFIVTTCFFFYSNTRMRVAQYLSEKNWAKKQKVFCKKSKLTLTIPAGYAIIL